MKITVNKEERRVLKAVIGTDGFGFYIRGLNSTVVYIGPAGQVITQTRDKLEDFIDKGGERTPIYEGDTLNITF